MGFMDKDDKIVTTNCQTICQALRDKSGGSGKLVIKYHLWGSRAGKTCVDNVDRFQEWLHKIGKDYDIQFVCVGMNLFANIPQTPSDGIMYKGRLYHGISGWSWYSVQEGCQCVPLFRKGAFKSAYQRQSPQIP